MDLFFTWGQRDSCCGYGETIRGCLLLWIWRDGTVFVGVVTERRIYGVGVNSFSSRYDKVT